MGRPVQNRRATPRLPSRSSEADARDSAGSIAPRPPGRNGRPDHEEAGGAPPAARGAPPDLRRRSIIRPREESPLTVFQTSFGQVPMAELAKEVREVSGRERRDPMSEGRARLGLGIPGDVEHTNRILPYPRDDLGDGAGRADVDVDRGLLVTTIRKRAKTPREIESSPAACFVGL